MNLRTRRQWQKQTALNVVRDARRKIADLDELLTQEEVKFPPHKGMRHVIHMLFQDMTNRGQEIEFVDVGETDPGPEDDVGEQVPQ